MKEIVFMLDDIRENVEYESKSAVFLQTNCNFFGKMSTLELWNNKMFCGDVFLFRP